MIVERIWQINLMCMISLYLPSPLPAAERGEISPITQRILAEANALLEWAEVSYIYGGHQIGAEVQCDACQDCLQKAAPTPGKRLERCGVCRHCSLDCSHFTQLVFARAGLSSPYLTTSDMLNLSEQQLRQRYRLIDLRLKLTDIRPGDLLVYPGHVVLVEAVNKFDQGNIIHATGGKDLKGPGMAIQRERAVRFSRFRGILGRILRHEGLWTGEAESPHSKGNRFRRTLHSGLNGHQR